MRVEDIIKLIYADKLLTKLRKKTEAGLGTFKDTTDYCNRSAELLGRLFSENVLSMPDVERITANDTLLKDRYKDINDLLDKVQRTVDKVQGINIRPQHAPFNQERADQIGHSLTDKTVSEETIQRRAGSAPATMTRAMQDDYVEENAKFRSDAGLKTYLVRVTDGDCCEWCTKVAGRYEYGTEPHDIYRRHDNCGCSVTYENGRQRQNVWTKKTWEVPAKDAGAPEPVRLTKEQAAAAGAPPPKVFSKEEAKKLEAEKLKESKIVLNPDDVNNSSIDKSRERGIIKSENVKMSADTGFSLGEKQYEVKEDRKQVEDSFKYAKEVLGAGNVKFDKLKNNEVIQPMLEQINNLKAKHGKGFFQIFVDDTMSDKDFAMVSPDLSLHLNAKYMNSAEATADFLARMKKQKLLPKGFENTDYLITHEYMHFISRTEIDDVRSKGYETLPKKRKKLYASANSAKNDNEFAADSMAMVELASSNDFDESVWNKWKKIYDYFLGKENLNVDNSK